VLVATAAVFLLPGSGASSDVPDDETSFAPH
jgi:hypothetical protein